MSPPLPFLAEDWHFKNVCLAVPCWTGPLDQGERMIQPFLDVVEPVGAHVGAMPYPALNVAFDSCSLQVSSTTGRRASLATSVTRRSRCTPNTERRFLRSR